MSDDAPEFAEVAVPLAVHGTFTYRIPEELRRVIQAGSRVEIPFANKLATGFVLGLSDHAELGDAKIRAIRGLLDDDEPALAKDVLELCRWAADYYLVPIGEMLRVAVPANMASRGRRQASLSSDESQVASALDRGAILPSDSDLAAELSKRPMLISAIAQMPDGRASLERLRRSGLVEIGDRLIDRAGVRYDRIAILGEPAADLTAKQSRIVELLEARGGELPVAVIEAAGGSPAVLGALVRKNAVRIERRPHRHALDAFASSSGDDNAEFQWSGEQLAAIDAVAASLGSFSAFLLEGVTGSGKTEVYIEVMRRAVERGGQALLLVPEISLTPLFAARLRQRFGERIAILHSNLSASERYDQWRRARRGEIDVAIGARSALFTPFPSLGVIVVDEEGDAAYKQDESPRYHARDLAVVRASLAGIPIILGSATPSLESRENAARGKYELLRMTRRVEARPLPEVELIDLRHERAEKEDKGLVMFSGRLREVMRATFDAGEQAIILMNRRGYAPYLLCRECGHDWRCGDCSVTLTVHRRAGFLICHYCGRRETIPSQCTVCGGEVLQPIGFGTEKVEERFRRDFPDVPVDVLDRDSTRRRGELVKILDRFRRRETQALIGTQMLSKGHDFPGVTLTAVLNADSILGYPDFRSGEKTFYLLTQVAGRAGRGELRGRVFIQTAFPQHYAIQHATRHDYEAFFASEIEFRKTFHYPPVTSIIALLFRGPEITAVERAANSCGTMLETAIAPLAGTRMQGPAPAPIARIKGVWRYQILVRSPHRTALRRAVAAVVIGKRWPGADVTIDVDPISVL